MTSLTVFYFPSVLIELKKKYNITAIPKLVIVKENGEVITDKGRKQIRDQGLACFKNWLDVADIFQNFSG
ncbi:Nucleoredoxin-like protein 2 [Acipenser ruthenus]|uniref:Nucleoredoxin-like protein 2 n=1 Tax=Acipenser ruthenus TaxID=7906 RepID=A0A444UG81_ACIRT|nr:Nucleoredoxin-like protein 2 [Acipenser ruthenus]